MSDPTPTTTAAAEVPTTDWSRYQLDHIWQMVAHEDSRVNWSQYFAWRRMVQLCDDQAQALQTAMNQLATRWPPNPGSASFAVVAWIETLISSMHQSATAATGTQRALHDITVALTAARGEIAALVDQRRGFEAADQQWQPQPLTAPGQSPSAAPALPRPPTDWPAMLDQQAQAVMAATDAAVGAHAAMIQAPPRFSARRQYEPFKVFDAGGSLNGTTSLSFSMAPSGSTPQLAHRPPLGLEGPVLDESPPPPPVIPGMTNAGPPPLGPSVAPSGLPFIATPYGPVLAPGGMIGSPLTSASASASTGRGPASAGAVRGSTAAGPMLAPGAGGRPGATPGGGRAVAFSGGRRRPRQVDPDDPWQVPEGGPTVLEPPTMAADHDPGPGVIGLVR